MGCMSEEWGLNLDRSRGQSHGDQHQQKPGRKDVEKNLVHSILFFPNLRIFCSPDSINPWFHTMGKYHGEIPEIQTTSASWANGLVMIGSMERPMDPWIYRLQGWWNRPSQKMKVDLGSFSQLLCDL